MDTETTIAQGVHIADENAAYDAACKRVLSEKAILARIMKACLSEYQDCDVNDIAEKYIEGQPQVSSIPVLPDEDGTIIATSDGKNITFNVPASETWKAGEPTRSASSSTGQTSSAGTSAPSKSSGDAPVSDGLADAPAGDADTAPQPQIREEAPPASETLQEPQSQEPQGLTYVLNVKTKKFHLPSCSSLPTTNRQDSTDSRDTILSQGYVPCKRCNP